ncbi:enoyl-CoA hydratase/isomerase family protein [Candidatus Neomarinimicrobiota bacterium]
MSFIQVSIQDHIAILMINRPETMNAMNLDVIAELHQAVERAINNSEIGVIIITGFGDVAFVAGADIKAMQTMNYNEALEFGENGQKMTITIENSPKPVIAAVNGYALGGGCEIALACHVRIASSNARFSQPEVNLGIIPGWGGTQRLPRLIGKGKAIELIAGGAMISADEALSIGLVNHVTSPDELMNYCLNLAGNILKNGPTAIAAALKCVNTGLDATLLQGLRYEVETFASLFGSDEQKEGIIAFLKKRKPKFRN